MGFGRAQPQPVTEPLPKGVAWRGVPLPAIVAKTGLSYGSVHRPGSSLRLGVCICVPARLPQSERVAAQETRDGWLIPSVGGLVGKDVRLTGGSGLAARTQKCVSPTRQHLRGSANLASLSL